MLTSNSPHDVDPVADTSLMDWDVPDSNHSDEQAPTLEASGATRTLAERDLRAAHSGDLRLEAEEKKNDGMRRDFELHQLLAEEQSRCSSKDRKTRKKNWKARKSQHSEALMCWVCDIKCTGQRAMDILVGGRARQSRERQAKPASVNEQLVTHYASQAAAPSGSDSAVYGRGDRAQSQSD